MPGERPNLCVLRGGGDLATGVAWRLTRAGWPVVVFELAAPLTIRRTVAVSSAVTDGAVSVEGMRAVLVPDADAALRTAVGGTVAVLVSPELRRLGADVVVDARLAKRNIDTTADDAPLVVGLGPGFRAGLDCDAVVETQRGHRLGRVIWTGVAADDTGVPGEIGGSDTDRVLRAPATGTATWKVAIGDLVDKGALLGDVDGIAVHAPVGGVVRGLIGEGNNLAVGLKIGDIDPRADPAACWEISDKALAIGGGVVEAVHTWMRR